ncbi:MAG: potassium transporter TrkA [Cytophagia bacterium]|nr:MAG: potassium transporter TrkA [Cytophagia bacterium]TAH30643.1 MAG: potassium transporter TrkA [Cytophagales bacterium]
MSVKKFTFSQRFKYRFDNLMTGGLLPLIVILIVFALFLTIFVTITVMVFHFEEKSDVSTSFLENFWQVLMHVIDQGTITDKKTWSFRLTMMIPTFVGIFTLSTLVALITSRIGIILSNLRKGRSLVIEENHIIILGWSAKIFSVLKELIKANANQVRACIVILADRDQIEMEDEVKEKVKKTKNVKIICRTGNPIDLDDLEIVNPHDAKSIIILSPDDHNTDAQNIKCILAIVNHPNRRNPERREEDHLYHIVAELQTDNNKEVANIIGGDELTLIVSDEVIARIAVQTCLQSGLSAVYNKILDFDHTEIYFYSVPDLIGKTFKEATLAYDDIVVLGILRVNTGIILLNPKQSQKIRESDKLICMAQDDHPLPTPNFDVAHYIEEDKMTGELKKLVNTPRNIMIMGWNQEGFTIVKQMDSYVMKGSELCIVCDDADKVRADLDILMPLKNVVIIYQEADISNRKSLNQLPLALYQHIMILSYANKMHIQEADAITLVALMHLREIKRNKKLDFTIISEMLDIKNRTLAEVAKPDDFIISDHVISLIVSQVAENKELKLVFDELFDAQGAEFYLKPLDLYVYADQEVNFYTITEAALRRNEIAIGYRLKEYAESPAHYYGVVLNPSKKEKIILKEGDKIIVLAEDL